MNNDTNFAPVDPDDGREPGIWESRYPDNAKKAISFEAYYVGACLFGTVVLLLFVWLRVPLYLMNCTCARDTEEYVIFKRYSYAWLGGTLGGTLFGIKWLYHSVAKQNWNQDRRLWRLFTPHLSGGLAFATVTLISSGVLVMFDKDEIRKPSCALAVAFLIGYFSDSATAKLAELAETLFGTSRHPAVKKIPTRSNKVAAKRRNPRKS